MATRLEPWAAAVAPRKAVVATAPREEAAAMPCEEAAAEAHEEAATVGPREEEAAVATSGCSAMATPTWAGMTPASPDHPVVD
jgi:hypothetical protein